MPLMHFDPRNNIYIRFLAANIYDARSRATVDNIFSVSSPGKKLVNRLSLVRDCFCSKFPELTVEQDSVIV